MPQKIQLTPSEVSDFNDTAGYVDGFVAGARALADSLKSKKVQDILAARQPAEENPNVPE